MVGEDTKGGTISKDDSKSNYTTGETFDLDAIRLRFEDLRESYTKVYIATEGWAIFAFLDILVGRKAKKLNTKDTKVLVLFGSPSFGRGLAAQRIHVQLEQMTRILSDYLLLGHLDEELEGEARRIRKEVLAYLHEIPEVKGIAAVSIGSAISTIISILTLALALSGKIGIPQGVGLILVLVAIFTGVGVLVTTISLFYSEYAWLIVLLWLHKVGKKERLLRRELRPLIGYMIKRAFTRVDFRRI